MIQYIMKYQSLQINLRTIGFGTDPLRIIFVFAHNENILNVKGARFTRKNFPLFYN